MKKLILLSVVSSFLLFGCATTSNISQNPSEIEYKEITVKEYCEKAGVVGTYYSSYDSETNEKLTNLFAVSKGYRLTDVYIIGTENKIENDRNEVLFELYDGSSGHVAYIYATDYIVDKTKSDPGFIARIKTLKNNKKYNGNYTVYIYGVREGDLFSGYITKAVLYDIEGIPSQEQLDADIAAENAEKLAEEEANKKANAEKQARLDKIGKNLAQNYIYHGIEEDSSNSKLFDSGALEEGHAYYISNYMVYAGGEMGGAVTSLFVSPNYQYVKYANQKIRGEVVSAGKTIFGNLPISVVVAGGSAPLYIPVILGVVEE